MHVIKKAFSRVQLKLLLTLIFIVAPLNISFFLMFPYEKSILPVVGMERPIPTIIVNIIYSIVSAFVVMILFVNCASKTRAIKTKDYFIIPAVFILLRLIFDVIVIYAAPAFHNTTYHLIDITTILFWIIFTAFLLLYMKVKIGNKKLFAILSTVLFISLLTVTIIVDNGFTNTTEAAMNKYYPFSDKLNAATMNIGFNNQVFNMIVDGLALVFVCWIVALSNANDFLQIEKNKKPSYKLFNFAIGFMFIIIGLTFFKHFVFPYRSLSSIRTYHSDPHNLIEKEIEVSIKEPCWFRYDNYGEEKEVYFAAICTVRYGDEVLIKTERKAHPEEEYNKSVYEVDGIEVYAVLDNNVFAYAKDGKAYAYRAKELPEAERDDVLISAFEKMYLEEPDWEEFENVCTYLLRYDPDFIKPILERYSAGQFYQYELDYNPSIMPEYAMKSAEKLLGLTF